MKKALLMVAGTALVGAGTALASGFQVDTHGARATGMATAVTAGVDDAEAVFYNPAGLAHGDLLDVYVGDTLISPSIKFTPQGGGSSASTIPTAVFPPHVYAAAAINDQWSAGIGLFEPYGNLLRWSNSWVGQQLVTKSALTSYDINPEVAWRWQHLRLGVGFQIVRATVELDRNINYVDSMGGAQLGGGGWGFGGNAGVQYDVLPGMLTLGATYRSPAHVPLSGNIHFTYVPPAFQSTLVDSSATTFVTLPETVALGANYRALPNLHLGLDILYTGWQRFGSLDVNFANPALPPLVAVKSWKHSINYHLGGELALGDRLLVRLGILIDPTPSPDFTMSPDLPDSNRVNLAAGVGYRTGPFRADLGYQFVIFSTATSTYAPLPGSYSGSAQLVGLSFGYRL